jgi:DNA-binding GntR family transcriptional regulator
MEPVDNAPILFDVVYQKLLAAIVDCTLMPGQRILQAELAASLGVSRAPVSHALQVLKHQGLLQESGRKGLEVAPIKSERVRDLYQVRASLDGLAARMAAERVAKGKLPKTDAELFRNTYNTGQRLGQDIVMSKRVAADIEFHRMVHRISGNAAIGEAFDPLWPHIQRAMVLVLEPNKVRKQVWREHREIMDNILAGDPESSFNSAYSHAAEAGIRTVDRLQKAEQQALLQA